MAFEDFLHPLLGKYIASPQWVKTAVGYAYSRLPPSIRRGREYERFCSEVAAANGLEALRYLSARKLSRTIEWALKTVPAYGHYRNLLREDAVSEEILRELPLVTKAEIKAELPRFLSTEISARHGLRTFTGGSTAEPMEFFLHKGVTRPREYAFMDQFERRLGMASGRDLVLSLRGRNIPGAGDPDGRIWMYEPVKHQLILSSDHMGPAYMPRYVRALLEWKPIYIQAFPSALFPLAVWLRDNPVAEITDRIKGIFLYSENVLDFQMELFREVFRCPVLKHYGHSERVLMASSMPDDDRYFFWPTYGHLELVDEHGGAITEPGVVGEIVGTSFDNEVMPFIRYRTGDLGAWGTGGHPLLPGFPVIERITGRLQEHVVCRDGRLISIASLGAAHFPSLVRVQRMQFEQSEPGDLLLKVLCSRPLTQQGKEEVKDEIARKTQGGVTLRIVETDVFQMTPTGKQPMIVQKIPRAASLPWVVCAASAEAPTKAGLSAVGLPGAAKKRLYMLGTAFDTMGGISAVVNVYRDWGLFGRWNIQYVTTHCDGSFLKKLVIAVRAWAGFVRDAILQRVGLVHVHLSSRASFWRKTAFIVPCVVFGIPYLLHLHSGGFMDFYDRNGRLRRRLISWVFDRARLVLALTPEWQERLKTICRNNDIRVLYNPVPATPRSNQLEGQRHRGQLLFLGRLGKNKGSYDLVEVLCRLRESVPDVRLLCGGDGEVDEVRSAAEARGVADHIRMLGWVRGEEKTSLFRTSCAYVLPSYHEGLPMGILEAMSWGLPVLSTRVGGIPDAVRDGVDGLLVTPGDIEAITDGLKRLLTDDEFRARCGESARTRIEQSFCSDAVLPQLEAIYREIGMAGPPIEPFAGRPAGC